MADQPRKRKNKASSKEKPVTRKNEVKILQEPIADPPHVYIIVFVLVAFLAMLTAFIWLQYDDKASQQFEEFIEGLMPKNRYQKKP